MEISGKLTIRNQRVENSIIPFPGELIRKSDGELEHYFNNLDSYDVFPSYDLLPDTITSDGFDQYASWLACLTQSDEEHRERAATIHLDKLQHRLIYPINPAIGTVNSAYTVEGHGDRFLPIVRCHSHPNSTCFSTHDLKRAMFYDLFVAELLGGLDRNFLLLRTDQTRLSDPAQAFTKMDNLSKEIQESAAFMQQEFDKAVNEGLMPKEVADYLYGLALKTEIEEYGCRFPFVGLTYTVTYTVGEAYKLGVYVSEKKGIFKRLTKEMVHNLQTKNEQLIEAAYANIRKKINKLIL